jgi:LacI family transcriptional regulator, galactose operon repressor
VTMKDVAVAAGVSVATVSRVLANGASVAEEKRKAVHDACAMLGYRPDTLAAALRRGTSKSVGMLIPDITAPFFPAVVRSVEHELANTGTDLLFCDAANDVKAEAQRIEALLRRRVDALLVCPVDSQASRRALRAAASHVRIVQFERYTLEGADYVGVDQNSGMAQVAEHLRSRQVNDAVFLGLQSRISSIAERAAAFQSSCVENGISLRATVAVPRPDAAGGRAYARELLTADPMPDAVMCANDEVALGLLTALRAGGVRCPEDILVVGYDDVPAAELMGLTTVRQPLHELGREAARMLRYPSAAARQILITPSLVVRETTAAEAHQHGSPTVPLPSAGKPQIP